MAPRNSLFFVLLVVAVCLFVRWVMWYFCFCLLLCCLPHLLVCHIFWQARHCFLFDLFCFRFFLFSFL